MFIMQSWMESFQRWIASLGPWGRVMVIAGIALVSFVLIVIVYFQKSIQTRLDDMERRLSKGLVYRDEMGKGQKRTRAMELHPDFQTGVMSLGQYLSSLRISDESMPELLQRELEATIGSTLLQHFGPRLGAALLPMLGISQVDSWITKAAGAIAAFVASHVLVEVVSENDDVAAFPFSVSEIVAFVNLNQKIRSAEAPAINPLEWMQRGEIGYSPSFTSTSDDDNSCHDLFPNPFVLERHFESTVAAMEDRIRGQSSVTATNPSANTESSKTSEAYDPDDRSLPKPVPINERILPGLHMGWGDAKCTHAKREILRNRLLAVLMTKLSYNYHLLDKQYRDGDAVKFFTVKYNGTVCRFPEDLVQALLDQGHTIDVCPRSTITTFGIAACVLESDGGWKNIPMALFFRTGYEQYDGKPSYFSAPHGGLDLSITSGPLLQHCDIQFYVAIEGLCGWHSNHNVDVPWLRPVSTTEPYDRIQQVQAVRMAALLAVTFNSLATEMNLPFGGYGVLGVCNDSAAFIDFALRGETNMYPLISTGRFLFHTGHRLLALKEALSQYPAAAADVRRLLTAACNLDSDIHNSPFQLIGATRRYLANNPVSYFQLTEDSKKMMTAISQVYEDYVNFEGDDNRNKSESNVANFVSFLFQNKIHKD